MSDRCEHKGLESYMHNPGQVDEASGNLRGRPVEQTIEGAPRKPVMPMPAVPIVNGKPLGSEALPPVPTALRLAASILVKDLK